MDNKTNKHEFACNAGKVTEYEVKEHIDTIMVGFRGFSKEVSIVKWNDKNPVFDIRAWRVSDRDGLQYPLRGITFSKEEFKSFANVLNLIFKTAKRYSMIENNPCQDAQKPKRKDEDEGLKFFTPKQALMFMKSLDMLWTTTKSISRAMMKSMQ